MIAFPFIDVFVPRVGGVDYGPGDFFMALPP